MKQYYARIFRPRGRRYWNLSKRLTRELAEGDASAYRAGGWCATIIECEVETADEIKKRRRRNKRMAKPEARAQQREREHQLIRDFDAKLVARGFLSSERALIEARKILATHKRLKRSTRVSATIIVKSKGDKRWCACRVTAGDPVILLGLRTCFLFALCDGFCFEVALQRLERNLSESNDPAGKVPAGK